MKGLLLLGVGFLLFSSSLFGFGETKGTGWDAWEVQPEVLTEKLQEVSFPADAPCIIPSYEIAFGDQNKPSQEKKIKAISDGTQNYNSLNYHSTLSRGEWEKRSTFQVLRFILFCNLRL